MGRCGRSPRAACDAHGAPSSRRSRRRDRTRLAPPSRGRLLVGEREFSEVLHGTRPCPRGRRLHRRSLARLGRRTALLVRRPGPARSQSGHGCRRLRRRARRHPAGPRAGRTAVGRHAELWVEGEQCVHGLLELLQWHGRGPRRVSRRAHGCLRGQRRRRVRPERRREGLLRVVPCSLRSGELRPQKFHLGRVGIPHERDLHLERRHAAPQALLPAGPASRRRRVARPLRRGRPRGCRGHPRPARFVARPRRLRRLRRRRRQPRRRRMRTHRRRRTGRRYGRGRRGPRRVPRRGRGPRRVPWGGRGPRRVPRRGRGPRRHRHPPHVLLCLSARVTRQAVRRHTRRHLSLAHHPGALSVPHPHRSRAPRALPRGGSERPLAPGATLSFELGCIKHRDGYITMI